MLTGLLEILEFEALQIFKRYLRAISGLEIQLKSQII
jgi:hypothetical protein